MTWKSGWDICPLIWALTRMPQCSYLSSNCFPRHSAGRWVPQAYAQGRALWEIPFRIPEEQKRLPLSTKTRADMENHQTFRLPRILERQQRLKKLSLLKATHFLLHDKRVGNAPCLIGRFGTGGCVYKNAKRQTHLRLAQTDNRAFLRNSMVCVMRACSDLTACASSPSLQLPCTT